MINSTKRSDIGGSIKALFSYDRAFSRSLGWLTPSELEVLSKLRVGIVGLGGVGGQYAEILSRLGVQNFVLCDFDEFGVENTNRQNECRVSNYNRKKAQVIAELIKDINPQSRLEVWDFPLQESHIEEFCHSIDIYVDGLDFFQVDLRVSLFRALRAQGKPAFTAAPVGAGTSMICFTKQSMSFDDYFGIKLEESDHVKYAKFLVGLDSRRQMSYLVDPTRVDFKMRKAPSLPMGVYSCASVMATAVMKTMIGRGPMRGAPWVFHSDPYLMESYYKRIHWGHRSFLQKLKLKLVLQRFSKNL